MAHSRIFQLTLEKLPKEDWLGEDEIIEGTSFIGSIADYVNEHTDRLEDIQWFLDAMKGLPYSYNVTENAILFGKGFKQKYFQSRYEKFQKLANDITLDEFSTDFFQPFTIQQSIEEKYGFYIYNEDNYPMTLDTFIRDMKEDTPYYFGSTIDYHY